MRQPLSVDTTLKLSEVERLYIREILRLTGSVSAAARRLGIARRTLQRKLKRFAPSSR